VVKRGQKYKVLHLQCDKCLSLVLEGSKATTALNTCLLLQCLRKPQKLFRTMSCCCSADYSDRPAEHHRQGRNGSLAATCHDNCAQFHKQVDIPKFLLWRLKQIVRRRTGNSHQSVLIPPADLLAAAVKISATPLITNDDRCSIGCRFARVHLL
jgi:hypothetical protein